MSTPGTLVHRIDYRRLATQRHGVEGHVAVSRLPRVAAEWAGDVDDDDRVDVDLLFFEDAQRRVYVEGRIRTALRLTCQRCLRPYEQTLDIPVFAVVVGDDEAAARVPRADEPVVAAGDRLDLYTLVSDELLLAMPSVARCDRGDCRSRFERAPCSHAPGHAHRQDNPFAVLSQIKRDG